jgi:hypothetical protein
MTFILVDSVNENHAVQFSNSEWRSIVKEIECSGVVSGDRERKLEFHLCTVITPREAQSISVHFARLVKSIRLPKYISVEAAKRLSDFAVASSGFEVC